MVTGIGQPPALRKVSVGAETPRDAVAALRAGRFDEAARLAGALYREDPNNLSILQVLGATAGWRGDHREALRWFDRAARLAPGQPMLEISRAAALGHLGRNDEAVDACARALEGAPGQPFVLVALGNALRDAGRPAEAADAYQRALRADPSDQKALLGFAAQRYQEGDVQTAGGLYQRAAAVRRDGPALHGLALCAHAAGDLQRAESLAREAAEVAPGYEPARRFLAVLLFRQGRGPAALAVTEDYRERRPGRPEPLRLQAEVAELLGDPALRARVLQELLALVPQDREARLQLASLQISYQDGKAAETTLSALRSTARNDAEVARLFGLALRRQERFRDAQAFLDRAKALRPDDPHVLLAGFRLAQELCDWERIEALGPALRDVAEAPPPGNAWYALSMPLDVRQQAAFADATSARIAEGVPSPRPAAAANGDERLTIGYLTADVNEHPSMHLMGGIFARHDRERFRVAVFSVGPRETGDGTPWTDQVRRDADAFHDGFHQSDDALVDVIRNEGVDVLIDAGGHTLRSRQGVLARRPAPIQIGFMAYPGSVRAPWIDYIVSDGIVLPESLEPVFSEKPLRMPVTYLPTQLSDSDPDTPPDRNDLGLPGDAFVLACFCSHYKLTAAAFRVWMQVLRSSSGSVLWLLDGPDPVRYNLRTAAEREGVDPGCLVFAPRLPRREHLSRLAAADLAVDTEIYGGHTTTVDSLWAGVPVVTRCGEGFASRVAASLLDAAGLPELVTRDWAEYEALCNELARDRQRLDALRARLARRRELPLFDAEGYVRSLEDGLLQAWERRRQGENPVALRARNHYS